jgi:hypothetical protein
LENCEPAIEEQQQVTIIQKLKTIIFRSKTPSKQNQATSELKEILKRAEQAKINAIEEENYALAKQARRAEIQLDLILKQIRDVERAKYQAVEDDDFDRAQELTDQIRVLRDNAFEQVDIKFLNAIPASSLDLIFYFSVIFRTIPVQVLHRPLEQISVVRRRLVVFCVNIKMDD